MASDHRGEHGTGAGDSGPARPLPVDSDIEAPESPTLLGWPPLAIIGVVFAGGLVGGLVRYEVVKAWSPPAGGFPWSTFAVNTAGAFILALLVVLVVEVLPPSTYLRALVGTGFCGALTTFSSVAVQFDELAAHRHVGTAVGYLVASLAAGLVAGLLGLLIARRIPPLAGRPAATSGSS